MRSPRRIERTVKRGLGLVALAVIALGSADAVTAVGPPYVFSWYGQVEGEAGYAEAWSADYADYRDSEYGLGPEFGGSIFDSPKLTGDWFGARSALWDRGVTVDVLSTQYYQGVASGGLDRAFPYGGRNDYFVTLDGERLGLKEGLSLKLHGETRYGDSPNFITGAYSPVNEYLLVPGSAGVVSGLTAVEFNQTLSESEMIFFGKINLLDHIRQPLTGANGWEGFMNISLLFNMVLARTLPYSAFGGGYVSAPEGGPILTLSVYDTRSAPTTSVFNDLFGNGAVLFGTATLPMEFWGLPGHQGVEAVYSSGKYTNIQASPYLDPVDGLVFPGTPQAGTWALGYYFDQALWVSPDDPSRVWGVFGKFGIADQNPNPIHWTATVGLSGASMLRPFAGDTFGVAYFCLGLSDTLKQSARPLTPLGDEHGVELFYNYRLTPWCHVTPDVQFIDPFQVRVDEALVVGLRALLDF